MLRKALASVLSAQQKQRILQLLESVNLKLAGWMASSRWSASLYYLLLSSQFRREMHAVLQGRARYRYNLQHATTNCPLLRRNIHRLEKGLIMRPRRPVFAVEYIAETVQAYAKACSVTTFDRAELKWATDVLRQFFEVCAAHPVVDRERQQFVVLQPQATHDSAIAADSVPYRHAEIAKSTIEFEQLAQLFRQRRSVRWFLAKTVPKELIYQAVEVASQAPSACNRQPFRFDLITEPAAAQKIAKLAMGTVGFAQNIPCLIVVVGDLSCYPAERDRHVIYIDASLATMQLMLALETLGLSTCPINWPDIESREVAMSAALALEAYQRPVMLLAVGFADPQGGIAYSQKKTADVLIREVSNER